LRIRANVVKSTGATVHRHAKLVRGTVVPGNPVGPSVRVEIDEARSGGFYLYHYDTAGRCIADTWHATLAEAKAQARFEFEIEGADWVEVTNHDGTGAGERTTDPDVAGRHLPTSGSSVEAGGGLPLPAVRRGVSMTMTTTLVGVLAQHGNASILQLPERKFPAIAIEGDSFSTLAKLARAVAAHAARMNDVELDEDAKELSERLNEILHGYEVALAAHGIPLPY
jgi:hypothetical protein